MAEALTNSVDQVVGPVKQSSEEDLGRDEVASLFNRRIEFHEARKPFKGFGGEGNNGFKLETLNPSNSDKMNTSEPQRSFSGGVSGFGRVLYESSYSLDPELGFRITFRRIGAGLQNLGNTCFLNSVLQCLTYTEPLAAYLQSGRHKMSCRVAGFCALCAIQKHVSRALESSGRILVPKDLVSNLRCISRNFRNARQEDAHEYMVNLLESMHKCCLPSGVPSESPSAYEKSLVHKIFGGHLRSQVKCLQCSFCSNKFDPFLDLSLEIVKADSLCAALANFTAKEHLDGGERQYQCQQCKQKVRALKQLTVYKAPEVLTVHLKRFASHAPGVKIDKRIEFCTTLDLKPFVTGPNDGDLKYTLYGVLVHAGWSTHSGHYYCFVRTSIGMWYSLDDNQVSQVSEARVLQQKAYMLFYVRDRRNSAPKKTVDVIQRGNLVLNALGNRACNNFKLGSKEANKSESIDKKLNVSVSTAVSQRSAFDTNPFKKNEMKTASPLRVDGPSGNTSLSEVSLAVTERVNGTGPNEPSKFSSIKKDNSSEPVLTNPENILSLEKSVNVGCSNQKGLTASVDVQNCNKLQSSSKNSDDDVVLGSSSSNVGQNTAKDRKGAISEPLDSAVLHRCCTDASSLSKTKVIKGGGFSEVARVSDLYCPSVNGSGREEYKISEPGLSCGKSEESKLKVGKKMFPRCHATKLHLSSSIIFGAGLARNKKHRKRRHSMARVDDKSVLSDTCPSTSKKSKIVQSRCSTQSSRGEKHVFNVKIDTSIKLNEDGEVPACVMGENVGKTVKQSCNSTAYLLLQKTSADAVTEKLPDSRESRGSEGFTTADIETNVKRVAVGDLQDRKVLRWDVQEPGPLDCGEPRSSDSISIGYVADEWDEEYDRGKRKKVKTAKLTFGGPNPFQELASKKSKRKKQKVERYRPSTHPFRIR